MEINEIWEQIITTKIKTDSTNKFSLSEIHEFAELFNMSINELCTDILKINKRSLQDLKDKKQSFVISREYKNNKEKFLLGKQNDLIKKIIINKVKTDSTAGFSLEELSKISKSVEINLNDICTNTLGISSNILSRFKSGEFKKIYPKKYKLAKKEYFKEIGEEVLEHIFNERRALNFTSSFTYEEVEKYSNIFKINVRDFLGKILEISNYDKWNKPILKNKVFNSDKYKIFKDVKMKKLGPKILDSFLIQRIKRTGTCYFDRKEICELSKIYNINERDFIVYVLGKTESTYYDIKSKKISKCFSDNYKNKKEEILILKKQKFMEDINPNIRTYYSLEKLETLSKNLGISIYDLVVNIMDKSSQSYSRIKNNNSNKNVRTSYGEYKSGPLPEEYFKKNIEVIHNILRMAISSAVGYMLVNGYRCQNLYEDLLQEAYIYVLNNGNPMDRNGELIIKSNKFEKFHSNYFYKKTYFSTIDCIKKMCKKEIIGEVYDIRLKTKGYSEETLENMDINLFINEITDDDYEKQILLYFSQHIYSEKTIKEACKIFKMNSKCLEKMFLKIREDMKQKGMALEEK